MPYLRSTPNRGGERPCRHASKVDRLGQMCPNSATSSCQSPPSRDFGPCTRVRCEHGPRDPHGPHGHPGRADRGTGVVGHHARRARDAPQALATTARSRAATPALAVGDTRAGGGDVAPLIGWITERRSASAACSVGWRGRRNPIVGQRTPVGRRHATAWSRALSCWLHPGHEAVHRDARAAMPVRGLPPAP
jgi:hypothetical protein